MNRLAAFFAMTLAPPRGRAPPAAPRASTLIGVVRREVRPGLEVECATSSMTTERSRQVSRLYHAALGREPAERRNFLKNACAGDESLQREVESLLAYEAAAVDFLEIPAARAAGHGVADNLPSTGMMSGQHVGSYQILSLLGVGGMGEVVPCT